MTCHLLTSSRLGVWQRCPRQHHYRYEVGLIPTGETPRALMMGTAVHAGLESWWRAYQAGADKYALPAALHSAREAYPAEDEYAVALLSALITAYDARWCTWAQGVEVIGVEFPFDAPLINPRTGEAHPHWRLAGKIDALVRLSDGRIAIMEHKTTSMDASAGSDYRRALTLNAQVGVYFDGARALGAAADVCIYDVLKKPTIKPLLATPLESQKRKKDGTLYAAQRDRDETATEYEARLCESIAQDPDRYLVHADVIRTDTEMDALRWDLWHAVRAIEESRKAAHDTRDVRAIPRHPSACMTHHTPCAYLPVCEGTASARDPMRYQRVSNPHVELTAQQQQTGEQ